MLDILVLAVGEFQSNCYLVVDANHEKAILIDAGDDCDAILDWVKPFQITQILITHGHLDHVGALGEVRKALGVPVRIHAADVEAFGVVADSVLEQDELIPTGVGRLQVTHLPGHTPGSVAFKVIDENGFSRAIVGDAIFPGGPGHTRTPEDLKTSLTTLAQTVFTWPDEVVLFPGHGSPTTVGEERASFEAFTSEPLPADLCGDVTWRE